VLIKASVGAKGSNSPEDVRTVQILLNRWRSENSLPLLAMDGLVGPKTIDAITQFQKSRTGIVDGRVDPTGPALASLESFFTEDVLRSAAAFILAAVKNLEAAARNSRNVPASVRASIARLRSLGHSAGNPSESANAVLAFGGVGGPQRFGFVGVDDAAVLIVLAMLAILAAMTALVNSPEFQRAVKELGRLPGKLADLMSKLLDELGQKAIELIVEINDIKRRFDRCLNKLVNPPPACTQAIAVFFALQSQVNSKAGRVTTLARKIGLDVHEGRPPNPVEVTELESLIADLAALVPKWESALSDVISKCGCGE
jgi:hypothetical protein